MQMRLPVKFPRLNNMSICMVFAHIQRNRNGCKQNFETFDFFADVYIFFLDISSIFPNNFLLRVHTLLSFRQNLNDDHGTWM